MARAKPRASRGARGGAAPIPHPPQPRCTMATDRTTRVARPGPAAQPVKETAIVLTKEENAFLTQVGPGTPGGELLRRYWLPVCPVQELTEAQPTRFVRLLGEDLVLYKD